MIDFRPQLATQNCPYVRIVVFYCDRLMTYPGYTAHYTQNQGDCLPAIFHR